VPLTPNKIQFEVELLKHQQQFIESDKKFTLASGGYGSAKSFSLIIGAIHEAIKYPKIETLFCAATLPMLRDTTFKDFMEVCPSRLIKQHTIAPMNVFFKNGSTLKFRSFDQPFKAKSFTVGSIKIEELTTIKKATFDQLRGRLRQERKPRPGFPDFPRTLGAATNPDTKTHWVYKDFFDPETKLRNSKVVESTSYDNIFLPDDYLDDLDEFAVTNPAYFRRNVLGEWGRLDGLIYNLVDEYRSVLEGIDYDLMIGGLDFGHRDPTALSVIGVDSGRFSVVDEMYQKGMTSTSIIDAVREYHNKYYFYKIYCDGARPEIIEEMVQAGLPAVAARKGPGSVFAGCLFMQGLVNTGRYRINAEKAPWHVKEIDGYVWDASDDAKEKPLKIRDHTCDSSRYACHTFALENGLDVSAEELYEFQKDL
jgi:phage terminase large subunit